MKQKLVSALLVLAMLFGMSCTAFAVENDVIPYSSAYLDDYYVAVLAMGDELISVTISVEGVGVQDRIGILRIDIEQEVDGEWTDYDTMDAVDHPEFYAYNSRYYFDDIEFYGTAGVTYRVTVKVVAYKGHGGDTGYITSPTVLCK